MKYFVREAERRASHSSCYFEFQRGPYRGECWLDDSISLRDDLWDAFELSGLFGQALPAFDSYGVNEVSRANWAEILKIAGKAKAPWEKVMEELIPWVNRCFETHEVFTILGI